MSDPVERQREANRRAFPEAAAVMDELRRLGFNPKVTYMGPLRESDRRALKLEGRDKIRESKDSQSG